MPLRAELRASEPSSGKFLAAVRQVFSAEYAKPQHLWWGELWREPGVEVSPCRFRPVVNVAMLHPVIDDNLPVHLRSSHVIAQHELRRMRLQIDLVCEIGHLLPANVMGKQ